NHPDPSPPGTPLLDGHAYGAVIQGPGISIAGIQEVKGFLGKIKPVVLVKVFCGVSSKDFLKFMLKRRNLMVYGFGSRCKVVGIVHTLLMKIQVKLRHPLMIELYPLPGFYLRLPCPIPV